MASITTTELRKSWMKHRWLHRSWWVILFIAFCSILYLHSMRQKEISYQEMLSRLQSLQQEKALALVHQEDLRLQIESQSDPAFVELVLKQNLGLVSEGQTKVYFHQNTER